MKREDYLDQLRHLNRDQLIRECLIVNAQRARLKEQLQQQVVAAGPVFEIDAPAKLEGNAATVEAWVCDQPPRGITYRVLRDEWVNDYTVRLIHQIKVEDA